MRQLNLFSRPKTLFFVMLSIGSGFYGNQQVKRARRDPKYAHENLNIDLQSWQPFDMVVTTATGLKLRPARQSDLKSYQAFYGDAKTMATYLDGGIETEEQISKRLARYEDRVMNGYVWTGLAIEIYGPIMTCCLGLLGPTVFHQIEKLSPIKPSTKVIGNIAVGNGDEIGEVQLGIVVGANIEGENYQGKGHGTAASRAAVDITLFHIHHNKLVTINNISAPVTKVSATALRDNIPSQKILYNVWHMRVDPAKELADKQRQYWSTSVAELEKNTFSN